MKQKGIKLSVYLRLSEFLFSNYNYDVNYCIARVMLDKIHDFPDINIEEIAYLAKTTPSSVTKFCKKMNYSSFKELRTDSMSYNSTDIFSNFQQLTKENGIEKSLKFFLNDVNKKFFEMFKIFETSQLERLAKKLDNSKSVAVFSGIHGFAATNLFFELLIPYKIPFLSINRKSDMNIINSILLNEDMIFIISLSGQWVDKSILELDLPKEVLKKIVLLTYKSKTEYKNIFSEVVSFESLQDFFYSNFISTNVLNSFFISLITYLGVFRLEKERS